ncbi:MAG TPA: type II toxin-antitoxin system PemK/MazF family toxin [Kribbellaceae bacterium]
MIERGSIHWADLGEPRGHGPAKKRPVVVIQADPYNASRLGTVIVAVVTSNTDLATMPGNVFLPAGATGLPRDSVVNVTSLATVDKSGLGKRVGSVPSALQLEIDRGLRRVLAL